MSHLCNKQDNPLSVLLCLQDTIIFVDVEGSSAVLELSAIGVHCHTKQIIDVFHAYAVVPYCSNEWFETKYIHGLSPSFLNKFGFPSQYELIEAFKKWLNAKQVVAIYGNDPKLEIKK